MAVYVLASEPSVHLVELACEFGVRIFLGEFFAKEVGQIVERSISLTREGFALYRCGSLAGDEQIYLQV